jgi:hypothetical protein
MDTKDLHLSVMLGLHLQMAVMMLDLRANPVLHEEQKISNLPSLSICLGVCSSPGFR